MSVAKKMLSERSIFTYRVNGYNWPTDCILCAEVKVLSESAFFLSYYLAGKNCLKKNINSICYYELEVIGNSHYYT